MSVGIKFVHLKKFKYLNIKSHTLRSPFLNFKITLPVQDNGTKTFCCCDFLSTTISPQWWCNFENNKRKRSEILAFSFMSTNFILSLRKKRLSNTSSYHMHKQTHSTHINKCSRYHMLCKYWTWPPAAAVLTLSLHRQSITLPQIPVLTTSFKTAFTYLMPNPTKTL